MVGARVVVTEDGRVHIVGEDVSVGASVDIDMDRRATLSLLWLLVRACWYSWRSR